MKGDGIILVGPPCTYVQYLFSLLAALVLHEWRTFRPWTFRPMDVLDGTFRTWTFPQWTFRLMDVSD